MNSIFCRTRIFRNDILLLPFWPPVAFFYFIFYSFPFALLLFRQSVIGVARGLEKYSHI